VSFLFYKNDTFFVTCSKTTKKEYLKIFLDSSKVKNIVLQKFHSIIIKLLEDNFDSIGIKHIYRNYNKIADGIANEAILLEDDIYNF